MDVAKRVGRGVTNGNQSQLSRFYGRIARELGQVDTWVGELGIRTWPRESILDICPTR
jgi:hypothetical protein